MRIVPIRAEKNIALVAHDHKKNDLLDWARFNRDLLAGHSLYATGTTGKLLREQLELDIINLAMAVGPLQSYGQFKMVLSDPPNTTFDGRAIQEFTSGLQPGFNGCWWSSADPIKLPQATPVSGGTWTVAGGDVQGQRNTWGFDTIGFKPISVEYIRQHAVPNTNTPDVILPCGYQSFQALSISCPDGMSAVYRDPVALSQTVWESGHSPGLRSCRAGTCVNISY